MHSKSFNSVKVTLCALWVFALWAMPVLAQDTQAPTFEQQARQVLRSHLQQAEQVQIGPLLEELAQKTELPREQVQARLSAWMDTLEVWRKQRRSEWDKLVKSGEPQTSAREAEKFLRQFLVQARQTLEKQTDRPLEDLVNQAAEKAKVFTYQGRDLLLHLLSDLEAGPLPDKVGLLVEVRSELKEDYAWVPRDTRTGKGGDTSLAGYLLPLVADELGHSTRARWALGQPKPGLQSDWRLVLELKNLGSDGRGGDPLLTGEVILYDLKNQEELYRRPLQVSYHYSEDLSSQERADKFLGNVALKTRQIFEGFWAGK